MPDSIYSPPHSEVDTALERSSTAEVGPRASSLVVPLTSVTPCPTCGNRRIGPIDLGDSESVDYTLDRKAVVAALRVAQRVSPSGKRIRRLMMVLISLYAGGTTFWARAELELTARLLQTGISVLFVTACFLALMLGVMPLLVRLQAPRREPNGVTGQHRVVLAPDGLFEETAVNETRHAWLTMAEHVRGRRFLCLFTVASHVHCIPLSAFDGDLHIARFIELFEKYRDRARSDHDGERP